MVVTTKEGGNLPHCGGGGGAGGARLGHSNGSSHGDSRIYRFAYEEVGAFARSRAHPHARTHAPIHAHASMHAIACT